jgi:hypothetical protein
MTLRPLLFLSILIASCCAGNKSNISNKIHHKYENYMNKIFINKSSFDESLQILSDNYKVDFAQSKNIKDLNAKMQKTLLRTSGHERSDMAKNSYNIDVDQIFNTKHSSGVHPLIAKEQIPVILGATHSTMEKIMIQSKKYINQKDVIILTGDRPFYPEDFANIDGKLIQTSLESFDKRYKSHSKQISNIVSEYKISKENPLLKKVRFIVDLVALLHKDKGESGVKILKI